jgi:dipeptidyl aminopeptidase/acylaminoacyl peptidase
MMRYFLISLLLFFVAGAVHADTAPPVAAFADTENVSLIAISPDGKHMAFYLYSPQRALIVVNQVAGKSQPRSFDVGKQVARDIRWVGNEHLLVTVSRLERFTPRRGRAFTMETRRAIAINLETGKTIRLLENTRQKLNMGPLAFSNTNLARIVGINQAAKTVLIPARTEMRSLDLFEVSVATGAVKQTYSGLARTQSWAVGRNGKPVARVNSVPNPNRALLEVKGDKGWNSILEIPSDLHALQLLGQAADGTNLVVGMVAKGDDFVRDYTVNAHTGDIGAPLFDAHGHDMQGAIRDPYSNVVVGAYYVDDKTEAVFFDPELAAIYGKLKASFAGKALDIVSWDRARTVFAVTMNPPGHPADYYLFRPQTNKFSRISPSRPALNDTVLGKTEALTYTSSDGQKIHGYLTLPPGKKNKNLPLVTLLHNGSFERSSMDYNWMVQMLASNGYAVLQTNFRGSDGFGDKFQEAGYGRWNTTVAHDIDDGVKALIANGTVNPKKVCIFGTGFGGMAALLSASQSPGLYACAAAYAPVSDPAQLLSNTKRQMGLRSRMVALLGRVFQGEDGSTPMKAISPSDNAAQMPGKVLLIHSIDDQQLPISQSRGMARKLKSQGKAVTFVELKSGDSDLSLAESRVKTGQALLDFLKQSIR